MISIPHLLQAAELTLSASNWKAVAGALGTAALAAGGVIAKGIFRKLNELSADHVRSAAKADLRHDESVKRHEEVWNAVNRWNGQREVWQAKADGRFDVIEARLPMVPDKRRTK